MKISTALATDSSVNFINVNRTGKIWVQLKAIRNIGNRHEWSRIESKEGVTHRVSKLDPSYTGKAY
jgi:hypothetical protein